jgi:GGDEF domain-containing protein
MNYVRFERLVIGAGTVTVIGSVLITLSANGWSGWSTLLSQVLLLPVLIVAVHFGRQAGLVAAVVASAMFIVLEIPALSAPQGIPSRDLEMIAFAILAFGLVGIVGGDICGRVKYFFGGNGKFATIDEWSHVYNQYKASELIGSALARFSRYGEPFSVVVIALAPQLFAGLRPKGQRTLIRSIANHIRGDVRMIDEVARLDDGRFLVVLPHTTGEGGLTVAERLADGVRNTLQATDEGVTAQCLSASEDELELASLATSIASRQDSYAESSAYSASAERTL